MHIAFFRNGVLYFGSESDDLSICRSARAGAEWEIVPRVNINEGELTYLDTAEYVFLKDIISTLERRQEHAKRDY